MSNPDTWIYGTVLNHKPMGSLVITDTRVMFVGWDRPNVRQRIPVLLFLRDGMAPHTGFSMVGHVAPTAIHAGDWEVVE